MITEPLSTTLGLRRSYFSRNLKGMKIMLELLNLLKEKLFPPYLSNDPKRSARHGGIRGGLIMVDLELVRQELRRTSVGRNSKRQRWFRKRT